MIERNKDLRDRAIPRVGVRSEARPPSFASYVLDAVLLAIVGYATYLYGPAVWAALATLNPVGLTIGILLLAMGFGLRRPNP